MSANATVFAARPRPANPSEAAVVIGAAGCGSIAEYLIYLTRARSAYLRVAAPSSPGPWRPKRGG